MSQRRAGAGVEQTAEDATMSRALRSRNFARPCVVMCTTEVPTVIALQAACLQGAMYLYVCFESA